MQTDPNPRAAAAATIAAVFAGRSLDAALLREAGHLAGAERAFCRALTYGVVRERLLLEWLCTRLLERPLRDEPLLHALLLCGLQQLRAMRVPAHAAVAETVRAAVVLGKPWAKGLLNAVLRRYQRETAALEAAIPSEPGLRLSYPDWLVDAIRKDWPENWEALLAAGNAQGPLSLRVNARATDRVAYLGELAAAGIVAAPVADALDAVRLAEALPVEQIPGFAEGRVSVQDAAAQFASGLLQAQPGQRVLDACAAPGGKTAHLLERVDGLELLALDQDGTRLPRVRENLERLRLSAELLAADAARSETWWDGRSFDRILIDAPCSGSGVIRRHPDIKWLRRASDLTTLAAQQRRLLDALWPLLKPGGVLLYASCSVLRSEGETLAAGFLNAHADAREVPIDASWGEPCAVGRRIAPGGDFDGFYYARFTKSTQD